jgi:hypothetical protein
VLSIPASKIFCNCAVSNLPRSASHFRTRTPSFELLRKSSINNDGPENLRICSVSGCLTMYKPNFCAECGGKLLRLRWHAWTSRKFCDGCARRLRRERFVPWLLAGVACIGAGYLAGRAGRPAPPPLTIVRRADSPLTSPEDPGPSIPKTDAAESGPGPKDTSKTSSAEEEIYLCGARTKKGTPCSRRVHGPVRCWQHKGALAMLPQEKLMIKD